MNKGGRPSKGDRVGVLVRFPRDLLARIEATATGKTRHDRILAACERGAKPSHREPGRDR